MTSISPYAILNPLAFPVNVYDANDLRHERGHNTQLMLLGPIKYGLDIGAPSLAGYNNPPSHYHSQLWERSADWLGGVNNGPYENHVIWSVFYLLMLFAL